MTAHQRSGGASARVVAASSGAGAPVAPLTAPSRSRVHAAGAYSARQRSATRAGRSASSSCARPSSATGARRLRDRRQPRRIARASARRVAGGDERASGRRVHDVGKSAGGVRDHRRAAELRLHGDEPESLFARGHHGGQRAPVERRATAARDSCAVPARRRPATRARRACRASAARSGPSPTTSSDAVRGVQASASSRSADPLLRVQAPDEEEAAGDARRRPRHGSVRHRPASARRTRSPGAMRMRLARPASCETVVTARARRSTLRSSRMHPA